MNPFEYIEAQSLDELHDALSSTWDEAVILAGGTDLLDRLKEQLLEPKRVVNIKRIDALRGLQNGSGLTIGALTTIADLAADGRVAGPYRVLSEAASVIATPQLRNMGTVGGNLCQRPRCWYYRSKETPCLKSGGAKCWAYEGRNKYHAIFGGGPSYIVHPSDLAPALQSLDASVVIAGANGERTVPLELFFQLPNEMLPRETLLEANEVVTRVTVPPAAPGTRSTYLKFKELESHDFAVSSCAATLVMDGKKVRSARIALGGVAPVPWRARDAESALAGKTLDTGAIRAASEAAVRDASPLGENAFKIPLTRNLVRRALESLAS